MDAVQYLRDKAAEHEKAAEEHRRLAGTTRDEGQQPSSYDDDEANKHDALAKEFRDAADALAAAQTGEPGPPDDLVRELWAEVEKARAGDNAHVQCVPTELLVRVARALSGK